MSSDIIENRYKVRLVSAGLNRSTVAFDVSPNISESRTVNYSSLEPLHAPGQIQVYKNTSSRNYQISDIKLISRTIDEAEKNLVKLWRLRSWCLPRFGNSSTLNAEQRENRNVFDSSEQAEFDDDERANAFGTELLGAPPPVLYLSAYSKSLGDETQDTKTGKTNQWSIAQHINRVPVVIQQLTIPYPNDVDYITTSKGVPMPTIMNLDISLMETHSPNSYEGFDLDAFKKGKLQGF